MAGIAGVIAPHKVETVQRMLAEIRHRGSDGEKILELDSATLGAVWPSVQSIPTPPTLQETAVWDGDRPPLPSPTELPEAHKPFAMVFAGDDQVLAARDPLGAAPLYYGYTSQGALCFASEVKALMPVAREVHEFPPGTWFTPEQGFQRFYVVAEGTPLPADVGRISMELRLRLEQAIARRVDSNVMGSWLSGGLDSSVVAAVARPLLRELHSFAVGVAGAPDLKYARQMSEFLRTTHHEIIVDVKDLLALLPEVIYYLESFDALLVRSSLTNYLAGKYASDYVGSIFSGEGADELFAGYAFLKDVPMEELQRELEDISNCLHNTALQRVDRSASAHGVVPHTPFLDRDVVKYAMRIPVELKLHREGDTLVEKWILRRAMEDALPADVLWRRKAKFWQGAGVKELLAEYAEELVSDEEFARECILPSGDRVRTKEELMYYRVFREHFGELPALDWMGRTKGAPEQRE